jgi:hypothetical protein
MPHTTELSLTLNELRGTLKIYCPLSIAASLILPSKLMIYKENPAKFSVWQKIR